MHQGEIIDSAHLVKQRDIFIIVVVLSETMQNTPLIVRKLPILSKSWMDGLSWYSTQAFHNTPPFATSETKYKVTTQAASTKDV